MPGVIGASIFSPRPARGYRFHSLQVEIIVVLSQFLKPQSFLSNQIARQHLFVLQSEHLTTTPASGNQRPAKISRISPMMQVNPPQIMAAVAVQSRPTAEAITRSRRRASSSRSRLREVAAGKKIGRFKK